MSVKRRIQAAGKTVEFHTPMGNEVRIMDQSREEAQALLDCPGRIDELAKAQTDQQSALRGACIMALWATVMSIIALARAC